MTKIRRRTSCKYRFLSKHRYCIRPTRDFVGFASAPPQIVGQTRAGLKICAYNAAPITRYYYLLLCLLGGLTSDRVCLHEYNLPMYQARPIPADDRITISWYFTYTYTWSIFDISSTFFFYIPLHLLSTFRNIEAWYYDPNIDLQ